LIPSPLMGDLLSEVRRILIEFILSLAKGLSSSEAKEIRCAVRKR